MKVLIQNRQKKVKIDTARVEKSTKTILESLGRDCAELSILFVDNAEIQRLNKNFRGMDRATDVLSFAQNEGEFDDINQDLLGDVVISLEKAREQARACGTTLEAEIAFLLIHGTLHLLGYDHERSEKEREKMREKEKELMVVVKK